MKKFLLIASVLVMAVVFLPQETRAQYTDPYYNSRMTDLMIHRRTMEKGIRRNARPKKIVPKKKKGKGVKQKSRRAAAADAALPENRWIIPAQFKITADRTKKMEIC